MITFEREPDVTIGPWRLGIIVKRTRAKCGAGQRFAVVLNKEPILVVLSQGARSLVWSLSGDRVDFERVQKLSPELLTNRRGLKQSDRNGESMGMIDVN